MQTRPFGDPTCASILIIGHDPRLRKSNTLASYSLFADYYYKPRPQIPSEIAKYELASAALGMVETLVGRSLCASEVVVTNLCNRALPRPPSGKTVLIPTAEADAGIRELQEMVEHGSIRLVFSMSEQVNYLLQLLGFCQAVPEFLLNAEPKQKGLLNDPPYYEPNRRSFQTICGRPLKGPFRSTVFPIVHPKNWPFTGQFQVYEELYNCCRENVRQIFAQETARCS